MRQMSRYIAFAALTAACVSCGDVVREGRSPVYLTIDKLTDSGGSNNFVLSDVLTLVTNGGSCSAATPCLTIKNDVAVVTLSTSLKDITNPSSPNAPTANNDITMSRYHVVFKRADGRNVQGVDVPFAFDGAMTGTVAAHQAQTLALSFELVRHIAKEESPLVQLISSASIIHTIAEITFFGKDRVGNDVSVTGTMSVNFGNFADTP